MRPGEGPAVARMLATALADDPFIRWIAGADRDRATACLKMGERHGLVFGCVPHARVTPGHGAPVMAAMWRGA